MTLFQKSGFYFELLVTVRLFAPRYAVHLFPKLPMRKPESSEAEPHQTELSVIGLHFVNEDSRREGLGLIRLGCCLADHLDSGASLESWITECNSDIEKGGLD